jgi:tetratricopeptide (TPR) repeat protein
MKECPHCGKTYSEEIYYCPIDGTALKGDQGKEEPRSSQKAAQIQVRTLMLGFSILVLCALIAFTGAFLYQYWKPKYGGLTITSTPPGAAVSIDSTMRGSSPITLSNLRSGGHQIRLVKEGYKEFVQQVMVIPYATENLHWNLEPIIPQLSNEQLADIEAWRKKVEIALKENILLPPPDEYNVLYFANKILDIDPANKYATEVKTHLSDSIRQLAELAYAREDWLESEKQYKNLALFFPNDTSIGERLGDIAAKLDASVQDREQQIQEWRARADAAMKVGSLVPPDKDNALEAIQSIQRLDKSNGYVREAIARLKELLQNRGDAKIAAADWPGARNDFRLMLQYFPEDTYSKARLTMVEARLSEMAQLKQRTNEEQQSHEKIASLRQSAIAAFDRGLYEKSISEWLEYLKSDPNSYLAYFYLGACYQNQKQLDTAILNFEKSISINPDNVLAHLNLGLLYDYHRNNFKQAEEHLLKAKELGGAEKYTTERLQSMIQDLRDRGQASTVTKLNFPVEHKHAFSSCRGSLYFSKEGMEYRTSETDHSFYEAYKEMRTFAIEGNMLSIKTRNNKKYNFRFINAGDVERIRAWMSASRYITVGSKVD